MVNKLRKVLTYQKVNKRSTEELIKVTSRIAQVEGLDGHKWAAEVRKKQ